MIKSSEFPSTRALRTFMAVASTMSFSKAAIQLSVSQGAVSKQIAALEQQLGQPLFHRHINGINLTKAGERYLPKVAEALQLIQTSTANLIQTDMTRDVLSVNVTPSFASLWLIEHIELFSNQHPNLQISIKIGDGPVKSSRNDCDVYIRCLPLSKHHEHAHLLMQESLQLVGSNTLLIDNPLQTVQDLNRHTLIPQITRPQLWEMFTKEHQLAHTPRYGKIGYEHFYMSLEGVKSHQGLALLPNFMLTNTLLSTQLNNPLGLSMHSPYGYYLIAPNYKRGIDKVHRFEQWLNATLQPVHP
ncbi:LysR family transcriptional regulator [Vibrio ulleungensis]|uniref:LysR family transcriptional regulator n=1 Tax=Vibrio ulleungensis TaxID=2807619 RepID=A0ABS2HB28_9VIBR|nr:LysR family transcriptional regulator [Vibrio ulleungensis]MBM7034825.1 LysR family transcriptional regulator [Vibrio ulleungensis]